jgi:hypothetical protein
MTGNHLRDLIERQAQPFNFDDKLFQCILQQVGAVVRTGRKLFGHNGTQAGMYFEQSLRNQFQMNLPRAAKRTSFTPISASKQDRCAAPDRSELRLRPPS